jgi:hypothetical protein
MLTRKAIVDDARGGNLDAELDQPSRLICLACGRAIPFTEAELLDYIQNGWPRCCGEAMTIARDQLPEKQ